MRFLLEGFVYSGSLRTMLCPASLRRLLAMASVLLGAGALADPATEPRPRDTGGGASFVKLRYGVVTRDGQQSGPGFNLSYGGLTFSDLSLSAAVYPGGVLGLWANVEREAFSIEAGGATLAKGGIARGGIGPAVRIPMRPLWLELSLGYGFAQFPFFSGASGGPVLGTALRHAVMLGARLRYPVSSLFALEASLELPFAVATRDAAGRGARSNGASAGLGVSVKFAQAGTTSFRAALDYRWVRDRIFADDGDSLQTLSRFGLGLEIRFGDKPKGAPSAPRPSSSRPAAFRIDQSERNAEIREDERPDLAAGTPITAGDLVDSELATRRPATTGGLTIQVRNRDGGAMLAEARVSLDGKEYSADPQGQVRIDGLARGPVAFTVTAAGFKSFEEVAQVVVGKSSELEVVLTRNDRRIPASIQGRVRSTRGNRPVAATLEIPASRIKIRADARGAFNLRVPGGSYRVTFSAPGYLSHTKSVVVKDGDQAVFNIYLSPDH